MTLAVTVDVASIELLDHRSTDWDNVRRTTYLVRQNVRYDYSTPVTRVRQRLMLVPPVRHGDQTRRHWSVAASVPARRRESLDRYGNLRIDFNIDTVPARLEFTSSLILERARTERRPGVAPHPSLSRATPLTAADEALAHAAHELVAGGQGGLALAERICDWTARRLRYQYGVTSIATTAAEACQLGVGVCQDYAHVMLAVCRAAGLTARYVSGHLLGEGPSHAWVEVITAAPDGRGYVATAFDPTHARPAGLDYLTIATGRDYRDVAPTSGTCYALAPGVMLTSKQAGLVDVEYQAA